MLALFLAAHFKLTVRPLLKGAERFVYNACLRNNSFPALVSIIHWSRTYNLLGVSQVCDDEEDVIY